MTATSDAWMEIVRSKVAEMRFGTVNITIHEGRVTQIEATDKTRLPNESSNSTDRPEPEGNLHAERNRKPGARGRE